MNFKIIFIVVLVAAACEKSKAQTNTVSGSITLDYPDSGSSSATSVDTPPPVIACSMVYGCANADQKTCACTACITDLCPDGSSRNLKNDCQCPPTPVCDPIWPPPFPANQWLPYPDCKWTCVPQKCPPGKTWNDAQCKCICNKIQSCSSRRIWSDDECKCKCREPCQNCAAPQEWSEATCDCRCPAKAYNAKKFCNKKLTYWDEQNCACSCFNKPRECCSGKVWSDEICDCKCENSCKCAPGYVWDPYTCNCICPKKVTCSPINGVQTYFDEGSCSCLCENAKYSRCMYGFDHSICSCREKFCVQNAMCIKGYTWDKYQCKCVSESGFDHVCTKN